MFCHKKYAKLTVTLSHGQNSNLKLPEKKQRNEKKLPQSPITWIYLLHSNRIIAFLTRESQAKPLFKRLTSWCFFGRSNKPITQQKLGLLLMAEILHHLGCIKPCK